MSHWPIYGRIEGPIVMIGFGSIGKGTLPLIERHFEFDKEHFYVIDPNDADRKLLDERGVKFVHLGLNKDNYRDVLNKYLKSGKGQGFCVNLSVDTSSLDIMRCAREIGALYVDTVVQPWPGFYYSKNSATRRAPTTRCARRCSRSGAGTPAGRPPSPAAAPIRAWCPGSSSRRCSISPSTWARRRPSRKRARTGAKLAQSLGVKGVHIAERDTQRAKNPKPRNVFVNTWSVEGFLSEGMQPAELGWGTHEKWAPANAGFHTDWMRRGDLHQPARRQHPRPLLDADGARPVRLPRHPQRGDLDCRLLYGAQ